MIDIPLKEAKALFPLCWKFYHGADVPEDSPLRKKSEEIFYKSRVSDMLYVCTIVFGVLAKEYIDLITDDGEPNDESVEYSSIGFS